MAEVTISRLVPSMKPKILCLHGLGASSEILRRQTAALFKHALKEGMDYELEFIDSPTPVVWDENSKQVCCVVFWCVGFSFSCPCASAIV